LLGGTVVRTATVLRVGVRLARALRLTRLLSLVKYLPRPLRNWVAEQWRRYRLREGHSISLVAEEQLQAKYRDALLLLKEPGDYLEFGVYAGASMNCMYRALTTLQMNDMRLFGFDSFKGLPSAGEHWSLGMYKSDLEITKANLERNGVDLGRVTLVKGWYKETLTAPENYGIHKAGVIMIDCDLYSSAKTALDFCAPIIQDEAVVFFDDWWPATLGAQNKGEKRAFDEFLQENPNLAATELESYRPESAKVFLVKRQRP
jgi:predicted O-methyltransferase YrrM